MTNAERRERRREAGRKAAATRQARAQVEPHQVEPPQAPTVEPPRLETAEEKARRADAREDKRLTNLRTVLRLAQEIRREGDLRQFAHTKRWSHVPKLWTSQQVDEAYAFLKGFQRPDGTYQPDPVRRRGRWRL